MHRVGTSERVLSCPRCGWQRAPGRRPTSTCTAASTSLVSRVLRVVSADVRPELVLLAIEWLDERGRSDVFVPDELLSLVTAA